MLSPRLHRFAPLAATLSTSLLAAQTSVSSVTPLERGRGPLDRIAYVSDEDQDDVYELYGVPIDGSAPATRLSPSLPTGGDVTSESFAVEMAQVIGDRVVYVADQETDELRELYSVQNDGSAAALKLNGPLVSGGDVVHVWTAKRRVVYQADETVDNLRELYSVPADGSAPPTALTPGLHAYDVRIDGTGSLVVFTTFDGAKYSLHVVPSDGSQPPLFLDDSGTPAGFAYTFFPALEIAPGNEHVVYLAAEDDNSFLNADLYCARLDGSTSPVRISPTPGFVYSSAFFSMRIAPDGQRVLFTERGGPLYSVRPDGTGLVNLIPDGGDVGSFGPFRIASDSQLAAFPSRVGGLTSLYLAELDGSQSTQILAPIAFSIRTLELAPNGAGLVFVTQDGSASLRLAALTTPNAPIPLNGNPPHNQGITLGTALGFSPLVFTPDGERVVFRGDQTLDEVFELYSARLDGSEPYTRLNPAFSGGKDVFTFRVSADGKRVVYSADQVSNDAFGLYSVRVDGSEPSLELNQPLSSGQDVLAYRLEPERRRRQTSGF